jgi:hypothetical protein
VSVDVLFVAESLLPARGGAERFALELLGELAERGHRVRALWLSGGRDAHSAVRELPRGVEGRELAAPPRDPAAYWVSIHARCELLAAAAREAAPADVVVTQLHGTPAGVGTGVPAVVLLPSYESLCKVAHGPGATVLAEHVELVCPPPRDCAACPLAEPGARAGRRAQDAALRRAAALVACSDAVAAAARVWSGRSAEVAAPAPPVPRAQGRHDGHVLLAAGAWASHKGGALIEPIARELSGRPVVVTAAGLEREAAARLRDFGAELRDAPIAAVLDGASACIVPSQWPEPFGRIAFEAQACGIPVVAPRNGGLAEHVDPAGLLAPDAPAEAYAAAALALRDARTWAARSRAARGHAAVVIARRPLERAVGVVEAAARATTRAPAAARR